MSTAHHRDGSTVARDGASGRATSALVSLAVIVTAVTFVTIGSLALFSDQLIIQGDGVRSATVDLNASPASAVVAAPSMGPGDQVTSSLTISNGGSLEVRYAATSITTEDVLASELALTVKVDVSQCDDTGWSADGTVLYAGSLGSTVGVPLFGDTAPGTDLGDRVLPAGASEHLCLQVSLPTSAQGGFEGLSTSATFDFASEQTVNNP